MARTDTATEQSRTEAYKRVVMGLSGGFYPSAGRARLGMIPSGFPGYPTFQGMKEHSGAGKFVGRGGGSQSGGIEITGAPTAAARRTRLIQAEGINWDFSENRPVFSSRAKWPLAGNSVWYNTYHQDAYLGARDDIDEDIIRNKPRYVANRATLTPSQDTNVWKFLNNDDPGLSGELISGEWVPGMGESMLRGIAGGEAFNDYPMGGAPGRLVKQVLDEYRRSVGTYSGQLLTTLNQIASEIVQLSMRGARGTTPREVPVTPGALMPEEETRAGIGAYGTEGAVIGKAARPAGRGQTIDTFVNIGGTIVPADVTDMPISQGGHHGITTRIMSKENIAENLAKGVEGEEHIRNEIYKYYQDQIRLFNVAIRGIKDKATDTYITRTGSPPRPLTPAELSAPFRPTEYWIKNLGGGGQQRVSALQTATSFEPAGLGSQVGPRTQRARYLEQLAADRLSASAATFVRMLFRRTSVQTKHRGVVNVTKGILGFVLHWIRTWDQHRGYIENNVTVSQDPHVTAAIIMRMFGPNADRAYEFARLKKSNVIMKSGYATLHSAIDSGRMSQTQYAAAVFDMKAGRLHSVYHRGRTNLMLNSVMGSNAQLGKYRVTGVNTYVPDDLGQRRMERIHQRMLSNDYTLWNTVRQTLGNNWGMGSGAAGQFQNRLRTIQQDAIDSSQNVQRGERVTWPESSWITSMPYMGLLRQT